MKKSECIESQCYADEYFTYGEDGAIYDRDTGEKVARWDDLSSEELAQVEKWDDSFQKAKESDQLEAELLNLEEKYQRFSEENFFRRDIEDRRFLSEDAWGNETPPYNAQELIAAFDRKMNEFIRTADLDPRYAEEEIQVHADQLWEHYCETDEIDGVRSQWEAKANEPAKGKSSNSLAELMKSAQDYADTHTQQYQTQMVETRGKTR